MSIEDVLNFIESKLTQMPAPGEEEAAVQSGVPISRYVDGLTNESQLRGELSALGYKGLKLERYVLSAQLKRELALYQDRLTRYTKELQAGQITPDQFQSFLEGWGVPGENIPLELSKAQEAKPAVTLRSIQLDIRLLQVDEITPRPAEQALSLGIRILQAEEVLAPVTGTQPVALTLSILQVAEPVTITPIQPVELLIDIIGIKEE